MFNIKHLKVILAACIVCSVSHVAYADNNPIVMRESELASYSANQSVIMCGPYTWTVQWTTQLFPLTVKGRVMVSAGDKVYEFDNAQADLFSKVQYITGTTAICDYRDGLAYSQLLFGSDTDDGEGDVLRLSVPESFAVAAPAE